MNVMKKMAKVSEYGGGVAALSLLLQASFASAQTLTDPLGGGETFTTVATAIAGFLFWDVAAPLSVIMVLVGAFQLITSAGDPEKVSQGKKTITYAAIGLAIALVAGGLATLIQNIVKG
jgi:hypothetical protein